MGYIVWAGITFTGYWHLSSINPRGPVTKDITFANTSGRDIMQIGTQHTDETSWGVRFSEDGDFQNRLTAVSREAMLTLIRTIDAARMNSILGTLTIPGSEGAGTTSYTNMLLAEFAPGTIQKVDSMSGLDDWFCPFDAFFTQYL